MNDLKKLFEFEALELFRGPAVQRTANKYPKSLMASLIACFGEDMTWKIIMFFNGRRVWLPSPETLYKSWTEEIIEHFLDQKNIKPIRQDVANYLGLSEKKVRNIYTYLKRYGAQQQNSKRVTDNTIKKNVRVIFDFEIAKARQQFKEDFKGRLVKDLFHIDGFTDPEIQVEAKRLREACVKNCVKSIKNHLVLSQDEELKERSLDILATLFEKEKSINIRSIL